MNVGCIPKKLFHIGSMLKESIKLDAGPFGMKIGDTSNGADIDVQNSWEELRENVLNYIRSLNL